MRDTRWPGGWRGVTVAATAAAVIGALPASAMAQDATRDYPTMRAQEEPEATSLELTAYVGAILPMSNLGASGDTLQAELSAKPSFAASVEYWFGGGFGLGVMGGFASPDVDMTTADPLTGEQSSVDVGGTDYLHGEAVLLYRPEFTGSAAVLLPYFGAGAGVRKLSFEAGSGFDDVTDVVFVLNAGTHVRLGDRVHLRLDVRDLISSFQGGPFAQSDTQHDVFAQVGLGVGL